MRPKVRKVQGKKEQVPTLKKKKQLKRALAADSPSVITFIVFKMKDDSCMFIGYLKSLFIVFIHTHIHAYLISQ